MKHLHQKYRYGFRIRRVIEARSRVAPYTYFRIVTGITCQCCQVIGRKIKTEFVHLHAGKFLYRKAVTYSKVVDPEERTVFNSPWMRIESAGTFQWLPDSSIPVKIVEDIGRYANCLAGSFTYNKSLSVCRDRFKPVGHNCQHVLS